MVIKHNMLAINAGRQFGVNRNNKADSMEKLSSGYRINRAADDAAGLSISEKMRRQIRGLKKGVENTQEGISVCQVADGALAEVSDMLQRISELSIKSANGTNTHEDRMYIQQEIDQLVEEVDRIGSTTTFNEIKLFDGMESFSTGTIISGMKPSTDGKFFQLFGNSISKTGYMNEPLNASDVTASTSVMHPNGPDKPHVSVQIDMSVLNDLKDLIDTTFFVNCCTDCCPTTVVFTDAVGVKTIAEDPDVVMDKIEIGLKKADGTYYNNAADFCKYIVDSLQGTDPTDFHHVEFAYKGSTLYLYDVNNYDWSQDEQELAYFCDSKEIFKPIEDAGKKIWIHSGVEPGEGIWLEIGNVSSASLGIKGINASTIGGAGVAIDASKEALRRIMVTRSRIGAQQNRLEHTVANEENIVENITAAESRIRDTDVAKEMVRLSNLTILEQAGISMMTQANQSNQGVLGLL